MALVKIICLMALASVASSIEISSEVTPSTRFPSAALERLRNDHRMRSALEVAGIRLGDCGPLCELDLPGIIAYQGYGVEHHPVESIDAKVTLNMYRIPCGRNVGACGGAPRPPVLLQHGLLDSGTTWILNPVEGALGFILADAGFDVWIGNNRGNTYSPCQTDDCWKFSYDEMALFDLPSQVNYILNITGFTNISYVGHSEGTTQAFAGFSAMPELANNINLFVALAPAVFVNHQNSPLVTLLVDLHAELLFEIFGDKGFLPSSGFLKIVAALFCNGGIFTPICEDVIFALCGEDPTKSHDFNMSRVEVYLTHTPAGTSVQNMAHWAQAVRNDNFQMFDYGSEAANQLHYDQPTPPIYNLSAFTVPTAIFSGGHDFLADPEDVLQLMQLLPKEVQVYNQYLIDYAHLDFVWGMDASTLIYPNVVKLLKQYNNMPTAAAAVDVPEDQEEQVQQQENEVEEEEETDLPSTDPTIEEPVMAEAEETAPVAVEESTEILIEPIEQEEVPIEIVAQELTEASTSEIVVEEPVEITVEEPVVIVDPVATEMVSEETLQQESVAEIATTEDVAAAPQSETVVEEQPAAATSPFVAIM